jgi:hypothetical protein
MMQNTTFAALPPPQRTDEPERQLDAEDRSAMALLRLIVAAGIAVGLIGLSVSLLA